MNATMILLYVVLTELVVSTCIWFAVRAVHNAQYRVRTVRVRNHISKKGHYQK